MSLTPTQIDDVVTLRARAADLRILAARIEGAAVMTLHRQADELTWQGPGPDLCRSLLLTNQHQLRLAVEELRRRAALFDNEASVIEGCAPVGGNW